MIVKKSIISEINRKFIRKIKELIVIHYGQNNIERKFIICEEHIYGKRKVRYKLVYKQSKGESPYSIEGEYHLEKGISYITVYFNTDCHFDFTLFSELYFNIKGVLYHEIEHHLQRKKAPFREKISSFADNTLEYVKAPSELEAYLKELYFISKNTRASLSTLICSTSDMFEEELRQAFITEMYKFIDKRKDLNILANE